MVIDDVVPGFQDVQRYLAARGWRSSLSKRPNLAIWRSSDEAEEVLVPLSRAFADYASTMRTVATRVAAHEQRSTEAVLRDLVQLQSERVADQLRPQAPVHPTRVIAVVSELRGVANEQGALEGEVVLTSLLKGGPRRLRVSLSAADYRLAGQAHLTQQVVSVCGRVVRHGRTVELVEPERLVIEELVEPDDL